MTELNIRMLGQFNITRNGQPILSLTAAKVQGLLAFLTVESQRSHPRLTLANLFWPDQPDRAALHNLRQALTTLRQAIGDQQADPPFLLITRQTLQFNANSSAWIDVIEFNKQITKKKKPEDQADVAGMIETIELYNGDFLASFTLSDSQPFEEWLTIQRQYYQRLAGDTLDQLANHFEQKSEYEMAIHYARRHLDLSPWEETAHRLLMRCLALNGQRNAALAHYESCHRLLRMELNIEPAPETTTLFEQIRSGEWGENRLKQQGDAVASEGSEFLSPLSHLPAQLTSFVGRDKELSQLAEYLTTPTCRLITLVGVGGVGKTRLALQAGAQQLTDFRDGVHFVPLAALSSIDMLATAIGSVLNLSFNDEDSPQAQLHGYLRSKQMLLILDNFEHLLVNLDFVIDLLRTAPELKLLVTSRERLNLQAEWIFQVEGLPFPSALTNKKIDNDLPGLGQNKGQSHAEQVEPIEYLERFGAVHLFTQRAKQIDSDFTLSEDNVASIAHLCQLAEGLPLAIELAAAQIDLFSPDEIVQNLNANMDRLGTTKRDMPVRHRNLRALFDTSWERLTDTEQIIFKNLSVFVSGFGREAGRYVAAASATELAALVDQSMLRQIDSGRYEIHGLLRQYGVEKLQEDPATDTAARKRLCNYYTTFLKQRQSYLKWGASLDVLAEIALDLENIRAAWHWASRNRDFVAIEQGRESLFRFYSLRNWLQEGMTIFKQTVSILVDQTEISKPEIPADLKADLLLNLAYFAEATNDYATALATAQSAVRLALAFHNGIQEIKGYLIWGQALWRQGKYRAARALFVQALTVARIMDDAYYSARCLHQIGILYQQQGSHVLAREHITQALTIYRDQNARQDEALSMAQLGVIYDGLGDYSTARDYLERALAIYQATSNDHLQREPLQGLGVMHLHLGLYRVALNYFEQALTIAQTSGNPRATAITLSFLGITYWYLNDYQTALEHCQEALTISQQVGDRYGQGHSLSHLGNIRAGIGHLQEAATTYRQALYLRRKIGQPALATVDLSGLAWVTMAQGKIAEALSQVEDILTWIETNETAYLAELPQIYWTCYRVARASEREESRIQATNLLKKAYITLRERAKRIEDEDLRRSYLDNVLTHRQIIAAWHAG